MAVMYPTDIENYAYTPSEKEIYTQLKKQLPEKYHVFYSVRWFEVEDGCRVDSESDFIIFDPSFGFITLEVKGGKAIHKDGPQWSLVETVSGETSTRLLKCSPYEQAEKSMRHFYKYFHEEFHQSFNGTYGFAVAFPWYSADNIISSGSPKELTIDMNDMNNLQQKVNSIFHYWKNKRNLNIPFSAEQRKRFISLVNKRISLSAAAGALIPIHEKEFAKINAIQDSILSAVHNYRELRFVGGAGTGKTFIAAKKAISEAKLGKKVLFTCCSSQLLDYVQHRLLNEHSNITCKTFSSLMREILGESYEALANSGNGFYDAVEEAEISIKYDAIVIDEGQDYDVDMGLTMRALLSPNYSTFYVFFDENQNVFAKDFTNSFAIEAPPIILRYNIRNTGRIYENATSKTGLGLETVANSLLGIEPEYHDYKNAQQCLTALTNIVNRLTVNEYVPSKSIVVLSNRAFDKSVLKTENGIGRLGIDKSENSAIIDEDTIRFSTIPAFKGMEADVVILLNHVKKHEALSKEEICAQYVALTRARYYLYVLNIISQE